MKDRFINFLINYIKKYNNYNDIKIEEIRYGLEGLYLTITKLVIICLVAYFLNIFKEFIIFLIFYNIIRTTSFGLHATKSWICLISSLTVFILAPILCKYIIIPNYMKLIIGIILLLLYYKNAPADTYKRPIVSSKRRFTYKILSLIIVTIYLILSITIKDNFISNCLLLSLIVQAFIISPYVYKLFNLPYDNYKTYIKENLV